MKKAGTLLFLFLITCFSALQAQSYPEKQATIIDELQSEALTTSTGVIRIISDPKISQLIGDPRGSGSVVVGEQQSVKTSGYRVQVFSGNDPRKSKDEAFEKEKQVNEAFPEIYTYVTYKSPTWRLRVGNFRTREEAVVYLHNLKSAFPAFGKEMYVVPDEIKIFVNN